jgi:Ca2+/Na+ antiporter
MNWDSPRWKTSTKVLLGIATVWPIIYMALFFLAIFSFVLFIPSEGRLHPDSQDIDLIQLERKIQNGELKQLSVRPREFVAVDRVSNGEYHTAVTNESTRSEVLSKAREHDANGQPRVARIEEESDPPTSVGFPIGIVALFGAHILTIFLMMGLMPLYVILAVKNDRLDGNMKIIWVVLFCMLGFFAMPVYWYLSIWRKPPVSLAAAGSPPFPGESVSGTL